MTCCATCGSSVAVSRTTLSSRRGTSCILFHCSGRAISMPSALSAFGPRFAKAGSCSTVARALSYDEGDLPMQAQPDNEFKISKPVPQETPAPLSYAQPPHSGDYYVPVWALTFDEEHLLLQLADKEFKPLPADSPQPSLSGMNNHHCCGERRCADAIVGLEERKA